MDTFLVIMLVFLFIAIAALVGYYLFKKVFSSAKKKLTENLSDSSVVVSVKNTPSGKRLYVKIEPYEVLDNEPIIPEDSMSGGYSLDLMEKFFSGSLPEEQMQYLQGKLEESGIRTQRRDRPVPGMEGAVWKPVAGGSYVDDSEKKAEVQPSVTVVEEKKEVAAESDGSADAGAGGVAETVASAVSSAPVVEEEKEKNAAEPGDGKEKEEDVDPADENVTTVLSQTEVVQQGEMYPGDVNPVDIIVPSPFEEADAELGNGLASGGNSIDSEIMEIMLGAKTNRMKVLSYYCSCRLGLKLDFHFDPADKKENKALLDSLRKTYDNRPVDEVFDCLKTYNASHDEAAVNYFPSFEEKEVGGPGYARSSNNG